MTVQECQINTSTKSIAEKLKDIHLEADEEIVSFDVTSLYTNVPVYEAIKQCADLLFSNKYNKPSVSKETFIELAEICSCDVLMLTNNGYYRQKDGLAMGSPPAPSLANGWLSKFDSKIRGDAKIYSRYMDDILRDIKSQQINIKLKEINEYHPNLKFTIEKEKENSIPFLDMHLIRAEGRLTSSWYSKDTDTGLTMNYHALAPSKYKRSVVSGIVYRIFNACSTWSHFHQSMTKAKQILEKNQYPASFYEPIIKQTLNKIVTANDPSVSEKEEEDEKETTMIFVKYRGKVTENFERSLKRIKAPCKVILTLRKTKSVLPPLKPLVDKALKSGLVYKISCSRCSSCYVGQTSRHLLNRFKEHKRATTPVGIHFNACNCLLTMENVEILASSTKSVYHLMTLEALWINDIKPQLNTKDEYKSRTLTIKI